MQVDIHVDDVGLYDADLSGLADLHSAGYLRGVSVVANGQALASASSFVRQHPDLQCAVHVNLLEGPALSPRESVPLIVNRNGMLQHTFMSLWSFHRSEQERRAQLAEQIGREARAQINLVRERCNREQVTVDSHRYVHLLPFVWPLLVGDSRELGITGYRTVNEPRVPAPGLRTAIANIISMNPAKRVLLNRLSSRLAPVLDGMRLLHPDFSFGLASSGRMETESVGRALRRIDSISRGQNPRVELVFHPLRARARAAGDSAGDDRLWRFYTSEARLREMQTLASGGFRALIASYGPGNPAARTEAER